MRFPGFEGEWEMKTLSEVCSAIGDGLHGTPKYTESTDYYFINGNNLFNGKIFISENTKEVSYDEWLKNKKEFTDNTLFLSINGTIGNVAKYFGENVILGKSVAYLNFKENYHFFYHLLISDKIQNNFYSGLTGTTIKNLSLKTIRETKIVFPDISEQIQISKFLNCIDARIQTQSKIIERLETLMQGFREKIFSQQIRFKNEKRKNFPNWEIKKLGQIVMFYKGSNLSKSNISKEGKIKCIHYGELFTVYKEVINAVISRTNIDGFYSKIGDVLMPSSDVTPLGLATASVILENNVILGGDINVLRPLGEINSIFLSFLINFEKKKVIELVSGTTIKHIYSKDLKEITLLIPISIDEQNHIANFLSSINIKIETKKKILEHYKIQKKYLLANLFI